MEKQIYEETNEWTMNTQTWPLKYLFSKSKDGLKYLTCADCEIGPLGFHDPTEAPLRFLIAACRVKYDEWVKLQ